MGTFLIVLCILVAATAFLWLGYQLAVDKLDDDRHQVEQQRDALKAEWQQLDTTRRLRAVFLSVRRAMQAEAWRASRPEDVHGRDGER
jgi:Tfp pilus assembly protein PilO